MTIKKEVRQGAPDYAGRVQPERKSPFRVSLKEIFATPVRQRHMLHADETRLMLVAVRSGSPDEALAQARIKPGMLENMLHVAEYLKPENRVALMGVLRSMVLHEPDCHRLWPSKPRPLKYAVGKLGSFERDLVDCLASGWTIEDIREQFRMDEDAVRVHIEALVKKFKYLGAENERDLAAIGLVSSIRASRAERPVERNAVATPAAAL